MTSVGKTRPVLSICRALSLSLPLVTGLTQVLTRISRPTVSVLASGTRVNVGLWPTRGGHAYDAHLLAQMTMPALSLLSYTKF